MNIVRMRIKEGMLDQWRARIMENMQMGSPPAGLIDIRYV